MKTLSKLLAIGTMIAFGTTMQAAHGGRWYVKADAGATIQSEVKVKSIGGVGLPFLYTFADDVLVDPADLDAALGDLDLPAGTLGALLAGLGLEIPTEPFTIPAGTIVTVGKPKVSWNTGFRFDLAGGYNINDNWAVELESGLIYNTADKLKIGASVAFPAGSDLEEMSGSGSFSVRIKDLFGDDLTMYQVPLLANVIYKFPLEGKFKPYVGGGLGGVFTLIDIADESESDFTFAYQVMAGGVYEIAENMEVDLSYKLLGSLEHDFGGVKTDGTLSHSIVASFTFTF